MTTAPRTALLGTALAATLVLAACGSGTPTQTAAAGPPAASAGTGSVDGGAVLAVVAAFYPLQFLAERVGGERVDVTGLTPPGAEAHDLELSPQALAGLGETDLVVVLGGFQPAVDEAVAGSDVEVVDLAPVADRPLADDAGEHAHPEDEGAADAEAHAGEPGDTDPHFWVDPTHMAEAARVVAAAMSTADPAGADRYDANAADLVAELTAVDEQAQAAFASCEVDTMVTAHDAFGYFADRYGFEIRSINGLSPDQEPDARTQAEISDFVAESGVSTVYTETLVSSAVADTVAGEAGVGTAVLDPVEGLSEDSAGQDYLEVMRANIDVVRAGQACA